MKTLIALVITLCTSPVIAQQATPPASTQVAQDTTKDAVPAATTSGVTSPYQKIVGTFRSPGDQNKVEVRIGLAENGVPMAEEYRYKDMSLKILEFRASSSGKRLEITIAVDGAPAGRDKITHIWTYTDSSGGQLAGTVTVGTWEGKSTLYRR